MQVSSHIFLVFQVSGWKYKFSHLFWYFSNFFFALPVIGIYPPGLFWCTTQSFIIRQDLIMFTFCLVTSTSLLSRHYCWGVFLFVLGKTSPFIRQSHFTYPGLGHSGSRLSRIFHTSVCPVTLSSSFWGDPQVSQFRQDTLYNPSSEFCELNMPRISPIQVRSRSIILVVWQLYGWCLQSCATYTNTTHMNK